MNNIQDLERNLKAATQRADAAERKLAERDALLISIGKRGLSPLLTEDELAQIDALSASAEPASPWIKCSDRLPDPKEHMRVFAVSALSDAVTIWATETLLRNPSGFDLWMPLPAVPAQGGDGEVG